MKHNVSPEQRHEELLAQLEASRLAILAALRRMRHAAANLAATEGRF